MTVLNLLVRQLRPGIAIVNRFISPITLWLGKSAGARECAAKSSTTKVGANWSAIHSFMTAAKSICSPMRCLTSLSHARGLVP